MNQFPEYEVEMEEIHHTQKLDKPSGTAITTAEKILSKMNRLKQWSLDNKNNTFDLAIKAIREENVPGTHSVKYESDIDIIELKHEAKNRKGFALGAVLAAEFIQHKKGIFTMQDLLPL
jgi:4-hydroxy-tetrahydrodipicolinate reductase